MTDEMQDPKPWYTSRAMIAGYGAIALWLAALVYQIAAGGRDLFGAAEDAAKFVGIVTPLLGGLAILGIRGAKTPVAVLLVFVLLVGVGCATDGTGSRTDPQTGTTTVGAQTFSGRTQAGATYIIKSEGTVYNIDTDGSPSSKAAVEAIAKAILAYDKSIEAVNALLADATLDAELRKDALATLKWIVAEKRLYMAEAKGAFGVNITVKSEGEGHGSSTVDTAGATGETGVPPTTEPDEEALKKALEKAEEEKTGDGTSKLLEDMRGELEELRAGLPIEVLLASLDG